MSPLWFPLNLNYLLKGNIRIYLCTYNIYIYIYIYIYISEKYIIYIRQEDDILQSGQISGRIGFKAASTMVTTKGGER